MKARTVGVRAGTPVVVALEVLALAAFIGLPPARFGWWPAVTITAAAMLWVFIGFRMNVAMINAVTGSKGLAREDNPKLYRMLENLCISRGLPMPKLAIIESDALNAFASGVNDKQFTVSVTSGLLAQLNDAEVEAVLAHELTHIRNHDTKLLITSIVFVGIVATVMSIIVQMIYNNWRNAGSCIQY